jgi:hypothetical protein
MIKIRNAERLFILIPILIFIIFCSGCLSAEERAEGKKNIKEAKPYLKQYVKESYSKRAKIKNYSYVTWTENNGSAVPRIDVGVSSCVSAEVHAGNDTIRVMYDLDTGKYSSDEFLIDLKPEIVRMFRDDIGFMGAVACDIDFSDDFLDVSRLLPVEVKPLNLRELCENVGLVKVMIYCINGDWNEDSFRSEDIINKFNFGPMDDRKCMIYVLNMYDNEKYEEFMATDPSIFITSNHLVGFPGNPPEIPQDSYIGKYASSAYRITIGKEMKMISITDKMIEER